ncbi:MAG: hypothetical protein ACREUA_08575 [Burkholderiales bacterium]
MHKPEVINTYETWLTPRVHDVASENDQGLLRGLLGRTILGVEVNTEGQAYMRFSLDDGRQLVVGWAETGLGFGLFGAPIAN